jgi:hypothetical protein
VACGNGAGCVISGHRATLSPAHYGHTNAILSQAPDANRTVAMINLVSRAAKRVFNDFKAEGDGKIA